MSDPFRSSLEQFDGEYPPYWNPEEHGNVLVGQLLRYEKGTTEYGPCDIAVVIREDTGDTVSLWLTSFVLKERFREERPRPGERIGVKYLGKQEPKHGGKPYNNYYVAVDRQGGDTPWDAPEPAQAPRGHAPPTSGPHAPPTGFQPPPDVPQRPDKLNLTTEWDQWMKKYRIEPWQEEAFARAHPNLPDEQSRWDADNYRVALALIRDRGTPAFERAVQVMAEAEPASQDDLDRIEEILKADTLSQKDRLRIIHARDSGWNDAAFWAVQFGNSLLEGSSSSPAPEKDLSQPDDDLPF